MHIKSLGAAFAFALLSTSAFAADLPSRAIVAVPPPIPVYSWAGFYIGGHAGYQFGHDSALAYDDVFNTGLASRSAKNSGVIGGGHIGYNFAARTFPFFDGPLGPTFVFGLEGDVDATSARARYALGGIDASDRENVQGSIRGRLGIAVDRVLFYATGGAAFGGFDQHYVNTITGATDSFSHGRFGVTVGAGAEYALTNNWSIRAEYRYTDFGNFTDNLANSTGSGVNVSHHIVDNRVLGGVSYKFDVLAPVAVPVVARY